MGEQCVVDRYHFMRKTILKDSQTGLPIYLPKVHGNTKIRNLITGEKDRTASQWRKAAEESAKRLIKAFKNIDPTQPF